MRGKREVESVAQSTLARDTEGDVQIIIDGEKNQFILWLELIFGVHFFIYLVSSY